MPPTRDNQGRDPRATASGCHPWRNRAIALLASMAMMTGLPVHAWARPATDDPVAQPDEPQLERRRDYTGPTAAEPKRARETTGARSETNRGFGSAEQFEGAPPPDRVRGMTEEPKPGAEALLWIPRVILFVPRWVLDFAIHPIRLGLMAYDRYALKERVLDIFFNEQRTFGVYPLAFFETGFGINGGGRLVHRDLLGHGERLWMRASFGQLYRQLYRVELGSGRLLPDRLHVKLIGEFRSMPKSRFYGLGNGPVLQPEDLQHRIDPLQEEQLVASRYRNDRARWGFLLQSPITDDLRAEIAHVWTWMRFLPTESLGGDAQLTEVFDTTGLVGYDTGLFNSYTELSLRYDSTRSAGPHVSGAIPSTGWLIEGFAGYVRGVTNHPSDYLRIGGDVQRFINIYRGDRYLHLRLLLDTVVGDQDNIPFSSYPSLGGPDYLRGYVRDRFRDRAAGLSTIAYHWPVDRRISAYVFLDTGAVTDTLDNFRVDDLRLGYGGGIQIQTDTAILGRLQLASSIDGGVFLKIRFEPAHDPRQRI